METELAPLTYKGFVIDILKEAYFQRLKDEELGSTKRITEELDILQSVIKAFQRKLPNEASTN